MNNFNGLEKIRLKNLKALPKTNYTIETPRMKGRICKATDPFDHCVSHLLYTVCSNGKYKTHK